MTHLKSVKSSTILAFAVKQVKKDAEIQTKRDIGYFYNDLDTATDKAKFISSRLSKKDAKLYSAGKLTEKQAIAKAVVGIKERDLKDRDETIKYLTNAFKYPLPDRISVDTTWKPNSTWGPNPHTEVWAGHRTEGKASGCGYDKESAATAQAFNENPVFARIVATCAYRDSRESTKERKVQTYGYRLDMYGAKFEGAVGYNCHDNIIQRAGYKCTASAHPKTADYYTYELTEAAKEA